VGCIKMTEQFSAPDMFVSGLDHVELIGNGCARFVLYVNVPEEECEGGRRFYPLVMPVSEVPDAVRKSMVVPDDCTSIGLVFPQWLH